MNIMENFMVRVERRFYLDAFCLYFFNKTHDATAVVTDMTLQTLAEGDAVPASAGFPLSEKAAQALMDELYAAGLRPTAAADSEGVQLHLSDMRKLVKKAWDVDL